MELQLEYDLHIMQRFTATYEQDEDGYWTATVIIAENNSAISDGATLADCKRRIQEAVAVALDCDESEFELDDLPLGS